MKSTTAGRRAAGIALLSFGLTCVPCAYANLSFAPKVDVGTDGGTAVSVAAADINGDGKIDLAVANGLSELLVYINTTAPGASTPSFAAPVSFSTTNAFGRLRAADLNVDGKPDLVFSDEGHAKLVVFINTTPVNASAPSFNTIILTSVDDNLADEQIADLNGDGKPDITATWFQAPAVDVLMNTTAPGAATATFAATAAFDTGDNTNSGDVAGGVEIADVNSDGKADVIVANEGTQDFGVLLNTTATGATTPTFAARTNFSTNTGSDMSLVAVADVNGDGKPDVICNGLDDAAFVFINATPAGSSTPSFLPPVTVHTGHSLDAVDSGDTVADMNGDGKPDLIDLNPTDNLVHVLLNITPPGTTTPKYTAPLSFTTGAVPTAVAVADLNGDGRMDLVIANSTDISVLLNTTPAAAQKAAFAQELSFNFSSVLTDVRAGDINGDGLADFVMTDANGKVYVQVNNTVPGSTLPSTNAAPHFSVGNGTWSLALADLNGDGKLDVATADQSDDAVSVLLNTLTPGSGTTSFAAAANFSVGHNPVSIAHADFNRDGREDLVTADGGAGISVLLNTMTPGAATASFAAAANVGAGSNPDAVAVGDVNNDGAPDVVVASGNSTQLSVLLNTTLPGAATASFATAVPFAPAGIPTSLALADLNGDGLLDIVVAENASNSVEVFFNTTTPGAATPSFSLAGSFGAGAGPGGLALVDLNGDGRPDIEVADSGSGSLNTLLNTTPPGASTASFAAAVHKLMGLGPVSLSFADINQDGLPDAMGADDFGFDVMIQAPLPVAAAAKLTTTLNKAISGTLGSTGVFSLPYTFSKVSGPAHGSITLNANTGAFHYTPASAYVGKDSFTFRVSDKLHTSPVATVSIAVDDLAPTAKAGSVSAVTAIGARGTLSAVRAYAAQTLTFVIVSKPLHGSVFINSANGGFTYTSAAGFAGKDRFTFFVRDAYGTVSNTATESVTVTH